MKTWENSGPIEACFISTKENFLQNKVRGANYISKYNFLKKELVANTELICAKVDDFSKFADSKILVVGGGPTAVERDWNTEDYDYIFSCNHFFISEKLKDKKVDLCLLCDEVKVLSDDFINYCKKFQPYIGFEDFNGSMEDVQKLSEIFPDKVFQCLTRFQGKIGVAVKLIILATIFGAKQVDFIGVDGTPPDYKQGEIGLHSFQKNKVFVTGYPYNLLLQHYKTLKDYLENDIGKDIIYNNLGAGHEYNNLSKL
jgi:hypothetical protein